MKLTPDILLNAYANGIFPMAPSAQSAEIEWYAPDPRSVLDLKEFHAPKRLMRTYRARPYGLTVDQDFSAVIRACASLRADTWLNDELIAIYEELHRQGHAHSVEAWQEGKLVGGLYGVTVPTAAIFCGESMFSTQRDASKLCLVRLVEWLQSRRFTHLDAQFQTEHLAQFGFAEIPREAYENLLGLVD